MKSFKCSVFYCNTPLKCGFVGNVSIYGNSYLSAHEIWKELYTKGIVTSVIGSFFLEAWHGDRKPRKVEAFSMASPQIYYNSHSDHRTMTMDGMNYEGKGNSVSIKFFDQRVMDLFLQELSTMNSIKETFVSRS